MSDNWILSLIKDYLSDIQVFMKYFKEKYQREDVLRAWHNGDIPQSGNVTNTVDYELHGIGCCIYFPDREVDFDFGPESRLDGIDLWRLKKYLNQRSDIAKHLSKGELEANFNDLVKNGVIEKIYPNSNLYFFKRELQS